MSDIRGIDPSGRPRDIETNLSGDVFTAVRAYSSGTIMVPGIGTASAYAAADAFGIAFTLTVPLAGTIATLIFLDRDDEGLPKEFVLFSSPIAGTADNGVFAPTDIEFLTCVGVVRVDTFYNYSVNQIGIATPALTYIAPRGSLYVQIVTQGADNIAAGAEPYFRMVIV